MFVSTSFLKSSIENYNKSKIQENFSNNIKAAKHGLSASFYLFILVIAIIFFILELFLLYFGICIAIYCSTSREERIVNFVLATVFTLPYILIKITFDPCTKNYLKNGMKI
jgi:hypothetical protein